MNKQEMIKTLEELKYHAKHSIEIDKYESYWQGKTEAYVNAIGLVQQLDEQQKPVVPNFVADWFEEHKDDLEYSIWDLCVDSFNSTKKGMHNWVQQPENNPIETLIRMLDGYEVEKETLYYVRLPFKVWDEESAELKTEFLYLGYDITSDETMFFPASESGKVFEKDFKTKLDEATIKSVDEKYWAFAVPVEQEEKHD